MKVEHILIRCTGCEQTACTVSCSAIVYIGGDLLIEASKCDVCDKKGFPIPVCIKDCRNSGDKLVLDEVAIEDKRIAAAGILPLLTV